MSSQYICIIAFFSPFLFSGLNARYESKHPAVHVSSQPHGQGWSLWQPGGKDEEETAHDAALWPQHLRYVMVTAWNIRLNGSVNVYSYNSLWRDTSATRMHISYLLNKQRKEVQPFNCRNHSSALMACLHPPKVEDADSVVLKIVSMICWMHKI